MDANLGLGEKILPDEESKKPQAKHIQTRLDYLLKVMKKEVGCFTIVCFVRLVVSEIKSET